MVGLAGRIWLHCPQFDCTAPPLLFQGLGAYGDPQRYQLYFVVFAIWAFQLWASPIWMRHFRFGPLEWLWQSLTYWQLQPFRRGGGGVTPAAQQA